MSFTAYATVQAAAETSRDLEIRVISHITRQLVEANTADADPIARTRALNGNLKLWSLLIQDLSNPENALPDPIKGSYISLGLFAHRTSFAALTCDSDLSPLIRINTDVLEALDQQRRTT
jgi:flagellar protein FlaF